MRIGSVFHQLTQLEFFDLEVAKVDKNILTIICLSRNRQAFLKRVVLAYSHTNYHLILADDSTAIWDWPQSGGFGSLTWEYFSSTGSTPGISYANRFLRAVTLATTEFVCFLDDEEVIFPYGLERAIDELELDNSIICAGGRISTLIRDERGDLKLGRWGRRSDDYSVIASRPIDRMKQIVIDTRTANLYYQVIRRDTALDFGFRIQGLNFQFHSAIEIFLALFLLKQGNWAMGRYPYWVRVVGPPNKSDFKDHMTKEEISWIVEAVCDHTWDFSDKSSLTTKIENTWGESSLKVSREELTRTKSTSRKFMGNLKSWVRKSPLLVMFFKRWRKATPSYKSFKVYFESHNLVSSDNILERAHIEAILKTYPNGVN